MADLIDNVVQSGECPLFLEKFTALPPLQPPQEHWGGRTPPKGRTCLPSWEAVQMRLRAQLGSALKDPLSGLSYLQKK